MAPHLPSYEDEYWEAYTYVTAAEVPVIAQYLSLIDESEFDTRFAPEKMKGVYRAPMSRNQRENREEEKKDYFASLVRVQDFYLKVAREGLAVLIIIG